MLHRLPKTLGIIGPLVGLAITLASVCVGAQSTSTTPEAALSKAEADAQIKLLEQERTISQLQAQMKALEVSLKGAQTALDALLNEGMQAANQGIAKKWQELEPKVVAAYGGDYVKGDRWDVEGHSLKKAETSKPPAK